MENAKVKNMNNPIVVAFWHYKNTIKYLFLNISHFSMFCGILGVTVEFHVNIRHLDSYVATYVTATNQIVIIYTVAKVTVRPLFSTVNQISSKLFLEVESKHFIYMYMYLLFVCFVWDFFLRKLCQIITQTDFNIN